MSLFSRQDQIRAEIAGFKWWHTIDFGDGIRTPGMCSFERLSMMADAFYSVPVAGKMLIDICCWDGFFAIEAAKRGAKVLATDHYVWHRHGWASRGAFDLARKHLAPQIEVMDVDVLDLSPATVGVHDIALFSGVLYHMRHPLLALEKAASVTREFLIVETHLNAEDEPRPAMIFYPGAEFNNNPNNWWGPNRACVEAMLRDCGFQSIGFMRHPDPALPDRAIFHAHR